MICCGPFDFKGEWWTFGCPFVHRLVVHSLSWVAEDDGGDVCDDDCYFHDFDFVDDDDFDFVDDVDFDFVDFVDDFDFDFVDFVDDDYDYDYDYDYDDDDDDDDDDFVMTLRPTLICDLTLCRLWRLRVDCVTDTLSTL